MFLLDTNIASEPIRRDPQPSLMQRWRATGPGELVLSVVSLMELRFGAAKSVKPATLWGRIENEILPRCRVLPFSAEHALRAGEIQTTLSRAQLELEWRDVMLAAVALHEGFILVTRNTRHFERVIGLRLENWFEPTAAPPGQSS
jgi:tRNA(fMet)-specific endonuclease VapC